MFFYSYFLKDSRLQYNQLPRKLPSKNPDSIVLSTNKWTSRVPLLQQTKRKLENINKLKLFYQVHKYQHSSQSEKQRHLSPMVIVHRYFLSIFLFLHHQFQGIIFSPRYNPLPPIFFNLVKLTISFFLFFWVNKHIHSKSNERRGVLHINASTIACHLEFLGKTGLQPKVITALKRAPRSCNGSRP